MYFSEKKSFKNYLWKINKYDERKALAIYQKFGFSEMLSRLISIREIDLEEVNDFINPTIRKYLTDPDLLLDMKKGVEIVAYSIANQEKICVFGDYDVDGVSSSALIKNFFDLLNVDSLIYIPDRVAEGYGPNSAAFKKLKNEKNVNLVLTVDCGISAYEPCKTAKEIGLKIVITDHHLGDKVLPEADAIIDPSRLDETTEYKILAGVGVGFLFLVSLNRKLREMGFYKNNEIKEPDLLQFLDLVTLGTICDVVPLVGLNRAFVKQGLRIIKNRTNPGIKSLIDISEIEEEITTYHVGFILGPRINATGRIGESDLSSKLLCVKDEFETTQIAKHLSLYNEKRQNIEKLVLIEVLNQIEKNGLNNENIIFIDGEEWHEGVIGIIASRIKDKFEKPTIILSKTKDYYRASCRSVHGVDIGSAILKAKLNNLIIDGGGHVMAGGFSVKAEKIDELKDFFRKELSDQVIYYLENKEKSVDLVLECKSLTMDLANEIEKLGPFGAGNHKPKIILKNVVIIKADIVGKNQNNLRMIIADDYVSKLSSGIVAMAFRVTREDKIFSLLSKKGQKFNLLGELNINRWQGKESIQFIVEDVLVEE